MNTKNNPFKDADTSVNAPENHVISVDEKKGTAKIVEAVETKSTLSKAEAKAEAKEKDLGSRIMVIATQKGYINQMRIEEDQVFEIFEKQFSPTWMKHTVEKTVKLEV